MPPTRTPVDSHLSSLLSHATRFGDAALTLLLPVECGGCATPDTRLCNACITQLERECYPRDELQRPVAAPFPVFAAAPYAALTRDCIIRLKEQQRTDLRRPLGAMLARALDAVLAGAIDSALDAVPNVALDAAPELSPPLASVPMPSSPASVGKRGFRHVELLAASMRPTPVMHRWLRAARTRADQVGLTEHERQQNANTSIRVARRFESRLHGQQVLLVDDIVTTGSSLRAAAYTLERVGEGQNRTRTSLPVAVLNGSAAGADIPTSLVGSRVDACCAVGEHGCAEHHQREGEDAQGEHRPDR